MKINLPTVLGFRDYHEINHFEYLLSQIIPGVKSKEIGYIDGAYQGIFYLKQDNKYKELIKSWKDSNEHEIGD